MADVQVQAPLHGGATAAGSGPAATCGGWLAANADLDRLDAELLVAHVLKAGRARVIAFPETELTGGQGQTLDRLAGRLRAREPLAYLLGNKEFFGIDFAVGRDVLVPRPESELLVELAMRLVPLHARVIDLGTGSGCIAVALKTERPDLNIIATDFSSAALAVASSNAAAAGVDIAFMRGDWLAALRGPLDCIVANPPYIAEQDPALALLCQEPRPALAAGADGMAAIDRIVAQAGNRMADSGCLILEHGCDQADAVRARLTAHGFGDIETRRDTAGHERATAACTGSRARS